MDLFGRKAQARIAELEGIIELHEEQKLQLILDIRTMDQLIFQMSQCSSWQQMQPLFASLKIETDTRMHDESNRIQELLIPELKKAYIR